MAGHRVYFAVIRAVESGSLREPFTVDDFRAACPGFADGTYQAFLYKHAKCNPGDNSELFDRMAPGKFKLIRPLLYRQK